MSFSLQKRHPPMIGRLVVCGHGSIAGDGVFCILSDNHGKNWTNGAALRSIPFNQKKRPQDFSPDECQVPCVEMARKPCSYGFKLDSLNYNRLHTLAPSNIQDHPSTVVTTFSIVTQTIRFQINH